MAKSEVKFIERKKSEHVDFEIDTARSIDSLSDEEISRLADNRPPSFLFKKLISQIMDNKKANQATQNHAEANSEKINKLGKKHNSDVDEINREIAKMKEEILDLKANIGKDVDLSAGKIAREAMQRIMEIYKRLDLLDGVTGGHGDDIKEIVKRIREFEI